MSPTNSPGPKPVILEETESALNENKTRLATFKRGLSDCEVNLEKLQYNLDEARLLVTKYKEVYRECLGSDIVSLEEVRRVKDIHERNLDMFVSYQIEKQVLVNYIRDLKRAIIQVEGKIGTLLFEKSTWNQILHFPTCRIT